MIKSSTNVIGIIFPNSYDALVPELVSVRLMASIPLPAVIVLSILFCPA